MRTLVANALTQPDEPRYRRVRLANAALVRALGGGGAGSARAHAEVRARVAAWRRVDGWM